MRRGSLAVILALASLTSASAQEQIETAPVADPPGFATNRHATPPPEGLFGFRIDRDHDRLAKYDLDDVEEIAARYKSGGMKWFYPRHVPSLFYPLLDSNLIPLVEYDFGHRRNPAMTSQAALAFYTSYVESGSEEDLRGFMNNVNWLVDHLDEFYLRYDFPWAHSGNFMEAGWVSAMAQGEALAAVSSAYFLTGEQQYLNAASGLFETLYSNSATTWSILVDENGYYWLEEYPNPDLCHILNGMLFGLWGLWDYYVITEDPFALDLFKAGIKTVADNYPRWDRPNINSSLYCLHGVEDPFYHETHIRQFEAYLQHFEIPEFAAAIELYRKEPKIALSDRSLRFGDVWIGISSTAELIVRNVGSGRLHVAEVTTTDPAFETVFQETTIPEGDSLVIPVEFAPIEPEPYSGVLYIESDAGSTAVDVEGTGVVADVAAEDEDDLPSHIVLEAVYPNPFSAATVVHVSVPTLSDVRMVVTNVIGQTVRVLHDGRMQPGRHSLDVDLQGLPSGLYYCLLEAAGITATRALVYVP